MMTNVTLYTAPWCGPCKIFKPLLDRVAAELKVPVTVVDIDADPSAAAENGVRSVPTLVVEKNGDEFHRHSGTMHEAHLREMIGLG